MTWVRWIGGVLAVLVVAPDARAGCGSSIVPANVGSWTRTFQCQGSYSSSSITGSGVCGTGQNRAEEQLTTTSCCLIYRQTSVTTGLPFSTNLHFECRLSTTNVCPNCCGCPQGASLEVAFLDSGGNIVSSAKSPSYLCNWSCTVATLDACSPATAYASIRFRIYFHEGSSGTVIAENPVACFQSACTPAATPTCGHFLGTGCSCACLPGTPTLTPTTVPTPVCTVAGTPNNCICNGDFEGPSLWDWPTGWSVNWSSQPGAPIFPLTNTGPVTIAPANTINFCSSVYWPYVRTVGSAAVYNSGGALNTVFQGNQSAELYSSRGNDIPGTTCGNMFQANPWAELRSDFLMPSTSSDCLQLHYAGNFQNAHPNDSGSCRFNIYVACNSQPYYNTTIYDWSGLVQTGQNSWRYLPWQTWSSPCVPPGCYMTVRFRATGCDYQGHACFGYVDLVNCQVNCCVATISFTPTSTPTGAPGTPTASFTVTATASITGTRSATATVTRTWTESSTATASATASVTPSVTVTRTATVTTTSSATATASPTDTFALSPTATSTRTVSETPSVTATPTESASGTPSGTPSETATATATASESGSPTQSATPTASATESETPSVSPTRSASATHTPCRTPTATRTVSPTGSLTWTATPTPTATSSRTRTATPTITPTPTVSPTVTLSPTVIPSPTWLATPTPTFPNPPPFLWISRNVFDPSREPLEVRWALAESGSVTITIYNSAGELVRKLWDGVSPGLETQSIFWDGANDRGHDVASNVYLVRLFANRAFFLKRVGVSR